MKHFLRYHLHQNRTTYSSVSNSAAFYTRLNVTMCGFSKYHKIFFGEKKQFHKPWILVTHTRLWRQLSYRHVPVIQHQ